MKTTYTVLRDQGHSVDQASLASRFAWYIRHQFGESVACDKCGVGPWESCVTKNGYISSTTHLARDKRVSALVVAAAQKVT